MDMQVSASISQSEASVVDGSLCNVRCTSRETLMHHASGTKHRRKVRDNGSWWHSQCAVAFLGTLSDEWNP